MVASALWMLLLATGQASGASTRPMQSGKERAGAPEQAIREITDPVTGSVWLLVRDTMHPGGPGRLVAFQPGKADMQQRTVRGMNDVAPATLLPPPVRIIRGGDHIVIEENSTAVEIRLAGVALMPAIAGESFEARLDVGGRTVRVIALKPGRARLAAVTGVRP